MENKKIEAISKTVKRYFGFLFETAGYHVRSIDYHPKEFGNWEVVLESAYCLMEICKDRTEILIYFVPLSRDRNYRIGLKSLVYFLSQGRLLISPFKGNLFWGMRKQFEELAELLKIYHDQIVPYFGVNFNDYKSELIQADRTYFMEVVKGLEKKG